MRPNENGVGTEPVRKGSDSVPHVTTRHSTTRQGIGDFTSLVTNPPTSDKGVTSTFGERASDEQPLCPGCGQFDANTPLDMWLIRDGLMPRWDADPVVLRCGWLDGRCGLCGLTVPSSSTAASVDESSSLVVSSASPSTGEERNDA